MSVLPVPPFGPSTQTSRRPGDPASSLEPPVFRAIAFWSVNRTSSGSCGSTRTSSAPAAKTRLTKPFGEP